MRNKLLAVALSILSTLAHDAAWAGSEAGNNTWYGAAAASGLTTGTQNTLYGAAAGAFISSGQSNVAVGYAAAYGVTTSHGTTAIGGLAGYNTAGAYNVFLGNAAGFASSGSNKLYIDNCARSLGNGCDLPLIYGEFDNRLLALDGVLDVSNKATGLAKSQLHFSMAGNDVGGWLTSAGDNNFFMSSGARYNAPSGGWVQRSPDGNAVLAGSGGTGYRIFTSTGVAVGSVASGLVTRLHIDYNGYVGLNAVATPGIAIMTGTGAYLSAGGAWTNASSRALKEDIRKLSTEEALRTLDALEPVSFRYKATDGEAHVGFIAEDVPQLLATKDRKGVSSMDVVAVLTKVVKEQQEQLAELAAERGRTREQLAELTAEVRRLKSAAAP